MFGAKGSIPIFDLLQQQDPEENSFCKWVYRKKDTQIYVVPVLAPKIGLLYRYSVGGRYSTIGDPFLVWVPL